MEKSQARKMVASAANLDELLAALQEIEAELSRTPSDDPLCVRVDELVDLAGLPTYGGPAPVDTAGVWSWSATRILRGEGPWSAMRVDVRDVDDA